MSSLASLSSKNFKVSFRFMFQSFLYLTKDVISFMAYSRDKKLMRSGRVENMLSLMMGCGEKTMLELISSSVIWGTVVFMKSR